MIRNVDKQFLEKLKDNMEKLPNGSYEPLFLCVKELQKKTDFSGNELANYTFEVLGGTHNVLATKELSIKYPDKPVFKGRFAKLFVGLND